MTIEDLLRREIEYYEQKRYKKAAKEYRKPLYNEPIGYIAWYNIGLDQYGLGEFNKAINCYKEAYST